MFILTSVFLSFKLIFGNNLKIEFSKPPQFKGGGNKIKKLQYNLKCICMVVKQVDSFYYDINNS